MKMLFLKKYLDFINIYREMEFLFSSYSLLKFHFQATNVLVCFIFLLKCVVTMHVLRLREILSNSLGTKDPSVK